jgi:hypothetical protein
LFASYALAFVSQLRKKHGKTSVRVVEKCPDIPVVVDILTCYTTNYVLVSVQCAYIFSLIRLHLIDFVE